MTPLYLVSRSGPVAGECFIIERSGIRIGRDASCEVQLPDRIVSKVHAKVWTDPDNGEIHIRDLGSRNGIAVNGERLMEHVLRLGDEVAIGRSRLVLTQEAPFSSIAGASESLRALAELARFATEADALDSLEAFAARFRKAVPADEAALAVFEEGTTKPLVVAHSASDEPEPKLDSDPTQVDGAADIDVLTAPDDAVSDEPPVPLLKLMGHVAKTRRAAFVDAKRDPDLARDPAVIAGRVRACLALPLVSGNVLYGVAQAYRRKPVLEPTARASAETAAGLVALAIERALNR